MHTKLLFLLMLRSSCTKSEKQDLDLQLASQAHLCEEQRALPWTKHSMKDLYQKRGIRVQYVLSVILPFWEKCQGHTAKSHTLDIGKTERKR